MGNIGIDLLSRGSVEEVVAKVRRTLKAVSAYGPHIMSSANTITSWVRPENYLALVNTTKQYGQYPLA